MTEFSEKVNFVKDNKYYLLVLSALIFPISYAISSQLVSTRVENYQSRIELFEHEIEKLQAHVENLELKKNSYKDIVQSSSIEMNFDELFSPSNN